MHVRPKTRPRSWWPLAAAAALLGMGCSGSASPGRAHGGLAAHVQAQVATAALTLVAASAASGTTVAAATVGQGRAQADPAAVPPSASAPDYAADLRIRRLVVSRGVERREPVGAGDTFALDEVERIYAFVEVQNADAVESEIVVTFEPQRGPARGHVRLRVGPSPRWRTWAWTRGVRSAGTWTAVVRDGAGEPLARTTFQVTTAPQAAEQPATAQAASAPRSDPTGSGARAAPSSGSSS